MQRKWRHIEARPQRLALNPLHHDIGLACPIAAGDEARHMGAGQQRHQHLLDLVADDGGRIFAALDARHLHDQREIFSGRRAVQPADAPEIGHPALMQALFKAKAVENLPGLQRARQRIRVAACFSLWRDHSAALLEPLRHPCSQQCWHGGGAERRGSSIDVIGHALEAEQGLLVIEQGVAGRRVAVARLTA